MTITEITTRALIIQEGHMVLCKLKGREICFMPGGGVEFGETTEEALVREITEEIGVTATVQSLWGIMENFYKEGDKSVHELSFIYKALCPDLSPAKPITSCEDHLEIFWVPLKDLESYNHMPTQLIPYLQTADKNGAGNHAPHHLICRA